MAQDERDILLAAEVGDPIPGNDAFNRNNDVLSIRGDRLQKGVRIGFDVSVKDGSALLVEDTKIHRPCMQIDTAVKFVLLFVKSHMRPPWEKVFGFLNHTCFGYGSGGP
jgi:hypothetical protein